MRQLHPPFLLVTATLFVLLMPAACVPVALPPPGQNTPAAASAVVADARMPAMPARGPRWRGGPGEAELRAQMLAGSVAQELITQEDADLFARVVQVLDDHNGARGMAMRGRGMGRQAMQTVQRSFTGQAVDEGHITQEDARRFTQIHDLLLEKGLLR